MLPGMRATIDELAVTVDLISKAEDITILSKLGTRLECDVAITRSRSAEAVALGDAFWQVRLSSNDSDWLESDLVRMVYVAAVCGAQSVDSVLSRVRSELESKGVPLDGPVRDGEQLVVHRDG